MRIITPEFNLIKIGYQGENEAVCVQFDVSNWPELYGAGGTFSLRHQRAGDPDGYPVIVTEEDGTVSWVVSNIDTRDPGYGKATLIYKVNDVIAMSVEYSTLTEASVGENPEPPEPWKPWIDEILEARDEAVEAAEDAHEDANSASQSADDASTEALKAEGYAVGTQDGEPVGPGSPYYQKNAKYYYEEIADEMGPVQAHLADHNNPHQVTAAQVGAIEKVEGAVADNIAVLTAGGEVADSGITKDWLVPVKAKSGSVIEFNSDGAVPLKSVVLKGKTEVVNQSLVCNNATYQLCGHNIWDEEWEAGGIDSATGANASSSVRFRSKNYIPCKPNTTLYYKRGTGDYSSVFFYDANKNYLGASAAVTKTASGTFTVPDGACYLRFYVNGTTTYGNDLAINYPATVTTYEPFHDGGSITADSLNGIGTVADERDATGHIDRRFSDDDLGTLTFTTRYTGSVNKTLSANLTDQYIGYPATEFLALSDKYLIRDMVGGAANLSDPDNKDVGIYWYGKSGSTTDRVIYIVCPVADTPSGNIVYRKATPTTDTTTPATLTTQKGYNILRTVSGDIQNAPADIEYLNGIAAVIAEALQ